MEYIFSLTDTDGRKYRQIDLPSGKFRMYEDRPDVWKQYKESQEELDWFHGSDMWFDKDGPLAQ